MVEILVLFNEWQGLGLLQVKSYVIFTLNAALKLFLSFLLNVPVAPLPCKRKTEQVWHLYLEGVCVLTVGKVFLFFWKTMILITFLFQAEAPLPRCHKRSPIDNQVPIKLFSLGKCVVYSGIFLSILIIVLITRVSTPWFFFGPCLSLESSFELFHDLTVVFWVFHY